MVVSRFTGRPSIRFSLQSVFATNLLAAVVGLPHLDLPLPRNLITQFVLEKTGCTALPQGYISKPQVKNEKETSYMPRETTSGQRLREETASKRVK